MYEDDEVDEKAYTAAEAAFLVKLHARTAMLTSDYPYDDAENERQSSLSHPAYAANDPGYSVVRQPGTRSIFGELTVVVNEDTTGNSESCSHLHAPAATTTCAATASTSTGPASSGSTMPLPPASASTSVQAPRTVPWPCPRAEAMNQSS